MRALPLAIAAALSLTACATTERIDAAADVHNFLVSIRNDDKAAFERYVDRRALTTSLEMRIEGEAARSDSSPQLKLVATALAGPTAKLLQQTLIRPSVFRLVAAQPLTGGLTFELIEGGGEDMMPMPSRGKRRTDSQRSRAPRPKHAPPPRRGKHRRHQRKT